MSSLNINVSSKKSFIKNLFFTSKYNRNNLLLTEYDSNWHAFGVCNFFFFFLAIAEKKKRSSSSIIPSLKKYELELAVVEDNEDSRDFSLFLKKKEEEENIKPKDTTVQGAAFSWELRCYFDARLFYEDAEEGVKYLFRATSARFYGGGGMARPNTVRRRHTVDLQLESVARITRFPIVESGIHVAGNVYEKIKVIILQKS